MKRIPLYYYVASNNPRGGASVLKHFNLPPAENQRDLSRGLRYVMVKFREEGLKELAKAHPDKDLILESTDTVLTAPEVDPGSKKECKCQENKSNACGCSSSANGDNGVVEPTPPTTIVAEAPKEEKETLTKEDVAHEVKKALGETNSFIKDNLPYIALIGVGVFLFAGILKK